MAKRRDFMKKAALGVLGVGLGSKWPSSGEAFARAGEKSVKGESAKLLIKNPDHPKPADYDRLPLSWYKATVKRLKERVGEKEVKAVVLQNPWNIIYFTGLFHSSTERPFYAVIPVDEDALYWYHPGLDRDLVTSWWSTENEYYFDYLHAEGGHPEKGQVVTGKTVDLFEWLLNGLKKRGFGDKVIGIDQELPPSKLQKVNKVLPQARFEDISDICLKMRMVKTPEEIALIQRAMNYFSQIHAFARDYILERGTEATDFEVAQAASGIWRQSDYEGY